MALHRVHATGRCSLTSRIAEHLLCDLFRRYPIGSGGNRRTQPKNPGQPDFAPKALRTASRLGVRLLKSNQSIVLKRNITASLRHPLHLPFPLAQVIPHIGDLSYTSFFVQLRGNFRPLEEIFSVWLSSSWIELSSKPMAPLAAPEQCAAAPKPMLESGTPGIPQHPMSNRSPSSSTLRGNKG